MSIIDGRTQEDNANAVGTAWVGIGGTTPNLDNDTFVEGTGSISTTADATAGTEGLAWDNESTFDGTDRIYYLWVNIANPGQMETKANGGIKVHVTGATATNFVERYFEGKDTYSGGWKMFVIDMNDVIQNADNSGGTPPVITAIQRIGITVEIFGALMPKMQDNLFLDAIWSLAKGTPGIRVESDNSGSPWTWADIVDAGDRFDITKAWGHVQEVDGVITLYSSIEFGDSAGVTSTDFVDATGAIVVFGEGANPLPDDIYEITIVGNGTGTTDIDFGSVVGSGDDRQGIGGTSWSTGGPLYTFDGETDIADVDTLNIYSGSFTDAGTIQFSGSTKEDIIGVSFINCGEVQSNDAELLNCFVISPADRGVEMLTTHTMKQITFVAGSNVNQVATFGSRDNYEFAAPIASEELDDHLVETGESDVALLFFIGFEHSNVNLLQIRYGSLNLYQFMTRIGQAKVSTTLTTEVWILYNPAEGFTSFDIDLFFDTAPANLGASAINLEGASRLSEISVVTNTVSAGTALASTIENVSVDTLTLDMIYLSIPASASLDATAGTSTETRAVNISSEASYGTSEDVAGVGLRDHDWTWTGSSDAAQVLVLIKSIGVEHMVHLPAASDYSITMTDMAFFGSGAAGAPKWHGDNSGSGADVTINTGGTTNVAENEFENTHSTAGTIDVVATVAVNVHVEDRAGSDIENAQVSIHRATKVIETSGAGNTAGDFDLVITGTIPADQPGTGYLSVLDRSTELTQGYRYTSHDGASTFTFFGNITGTVNTGGTATALNSTDINFLTADIEEGDTIKNTTTGAWAMVDEITDADNVVTTPLTSGVWGASDAVEIHELATTLVSGTDLVDMLLSNGQSDVNGDAPTLSYDNSQAPTDVTVRVRYNEAATKYIPFVTNDTIAVGTGLTLNVVLDEDTVAT